MGTLNVRTQKSDGNLLLSLKGLFNSTNMRRESIGEINTIKEESSAPT